MVNMATSVFIIPPTTADIAHEPPNNKHYLDSSTEAEYL